MRGLRPWGICSPSQGHTASWRQSSGSPSGLALRPRSPHRAFLPSILPLCRIVRHPYLTSPPPLHRTPVAPAGPRINLEFPWNLATWRHYLLFPELFVHLPRSHRPRILDFGLCTLLVPDRSGISGPCSRSKHGPCGGPPTHMPFWTPCQGTRPASKWQESAVWHCRGSESRVGYLSPCVPSVPWDPASLALASAACAC